MIFRDLRGMDVEYLVNEVARDSSKLWGGNRNRDSNGCQLFQEVVLELHQFPRVSCYSPLKRQGNTS